MDLFQAADQPTSSAPTPTEAVPETSKGLAAILSNLAELWDEKEYDEEFDFGRFLKKSRKDKGGK